MLMGGKKESGLVRVCRTRLIRLNPMLEDRSKRSLCDLHSLRASITRGSFMALGQLNGINDELIVRENVH